MTRIVVVGDLMNQAKTEFLFRLRNKEFKDTESNIFNDEWKVEEIIGALPTCIFVDSSDTQKFDMLRRELYRNADLFLVVFELNCPEKEITNPSYENVKQLWIPELTKLYPDKPILFVGLDLYGSKSNPSAPNHYLPAGRILKELGNRWYIQCKLIGKEEIKKTLKIIYKIAELISPSLTPAENATQLSLYTPIEQDRFWISRLFFLSKAYPFLPAPILSLITYYLSLRFSEFNCELNLEKLNTWSHKVKQITTYKASVSENTSSLFTPTSETSQSTIPKTSQETPSREIKCSVM